MYFRENYVFPNWLNISTERYVDYYFTFSFWNLDNISMYVYLIGLWWLTFQFLRGDVVIFFISLNLLDEVLQPAAVAFE